jgi:hypothetical protein
LKKLFVVTLFLSVFCFSSSVVLAQPEKCPEPSELEKTSIRDEIEVIEALNKLIPKTYKSDSHPNIYSEWQVETALPFPMADGNEKEEAYYEMAKNFCGNDVVNKSWLVRLTFPKAPGASIGQGQIFLAKSKEKGWFVWFRYH